MVGALGREAWLVTTTVMVDPSARTVKKVEIVKSIAIHMWPLVPPAAVYFTAFVVGTGMIDTWGLMALETFVVPSFSVACSAYLLSRNCRSRRTAINMEPP